MEFDHTVNRQNDIWFKEIIGIIEYYHYWEMTVDNLNLVSKILIPFYKTIFS